MNNTSYTPKVSFIISSYNHEKYVKKTIDSILQQSYSNIELLIIDDCSTDSTGEIVREYSQKNGFYFEQNITNKGCTENLRRLLSIATGDYVCVIASDDWIDLDRTTVFVNYLENNTDMDAVLSPVIKYFDEDDTLQKTDGDMLDDIINKNDNLLEETYCSDGLGILIQSGMFRAKALKTTGWIEGYKNDDWLLVIRFLQNGYRIGWINEHYTYYRVHQGNTTSNALYCLNELEIPVIHDFIPPQYHNRIYSNVYTIAIQKFCSSGDLRLGLKYFRILLNYCDSKDRRKAIRYLIGGMIDKMGFRNIYMRVRYRRNDSM